MMAMGGAWEDDLSGVGSGSYLSPSEPAGLRGMQTCDPVIVVLWYFLPVSDTLVSWGPLLLWQRKNPTLGEYVGYWLVCTAREGTKAPNPPPIPNRLHSQDWHRNKERRLDTSKYPPPPPSARAPRPRQLRTGRVGTRERERRCRCDRLCDPIRRRRRLIPHPLPDRARHLLSKSSAGGAEERERERE